MIKEIEQAQTLTTYIASVIGELADGRLRRTETELHLSHGFITRA